MATTYTTLKAKILEKLTALSGSGQPLAEVSGVPKLAFSSYPAAIIIPADGESDWETTKEDERTYAFDIVIYEQIVQDGIGTALDSLYDVVDQVMDAFAQDKHLQLPTPVSLPAGATFLTINPVAAGWGEIPDKQLVAATIKLACRVSIDVS